MTVQDVVGLGANRILINEQSPAGIAAGTPVAGSAFNRLVVIFGPRDNLVMNAV
jgi:hypothetical protein